MENYPIEQCYGCIHRQVCKHIPVIEKAMKLKDKLPLYIEEDCEDYAPEQQPTKTVKQSANDLTQEILKAVKGEQPSAIRDHVTMIPAGETQILRQIIECVQDAMKNGQPADTVYINSQMMEEVAKECQIDLANGLISKIAVGAKIMNLEVDDTLDYLVVAVE